MVQNKKKADLIHELKAKGYPSFGKGKEGDVAEDSAVVEDEEREEEEEEEGDETAKNGYDYLRGMRLWNLTHEKVCVVGYAS